MARRAGEERVERTCAQRTLRVARDARSTAEGSPPRFLPGGSPLRKKRWAVPRGVKRTPSRLEIEVWRDRSPYPLVGMPA